MKTSNKPSKLLSTLAKLSLLISMSACNAAIDELIDVLRDPQHPCLEDPEMCPPSVQCELYPEYCSDVIEPSECIEGDYYEDDDEWCDCWGGEFYCTPICDLPYEEESILHEEEPQGGEEEAWVTPL